MRLDGKVRYVHLVRTAREKRITDAVDEEVDGDRRVEPSGTGNDEIR
jgi:hypothetical protein